MIMLPRDGCDVRQFGCSREGLEGWGMVLFVAEGEEGRGVRSWGRVTGGLDLSRIFPNFLEMRRFCWYVDGPWLDGRMVLLSKL